MKKPDAASANDLQHPVLPAQRRRAGDSQDVYLALARHSLVLSLERPNAQAARMRMGITANHSINHLAGLCNPVPGENTEWSA